MSKILVNVSGADVILDDVGVTIAGSSQYTIPPQDYPQFAASSDVIRFLADPLILVLNDGGNDITDLSKAVDIIKGWPVQTSTDEPDTVEEPFFFDYDDIPVGSGPHTLLTLPISTGQTLSLKRVSFSCRIEGQLRILKNGFAIGQVLTGAAQPSSNFDWRPDYILVENDILEIVLTKRNGAPDTDVGVHVMGVTTTTT
jgi:hypothetical protein